MQEKKLSSLMRCHLVVSAILGILSIVSVVMIAIALIRGTVPPEMLTVHIATMAGYITIVIAICAGVAYLLKGAGKDVADLYKIFMLFVAASSICSLVSCLIMMSGNANAEAGTGVNGNAIGCVIMLVKVVLLLLLWSGKDIGRTRTWGVFVLIVAMDIVFGVVGSAPDIAARIVLLASRLITDLTIAFAIREKYMDKAMRGR